LSGGSQPATINLRWHVEKLKTIAQALMSNAIFWIFVILGSMVLFILRFERPVNFVVDRIYKLF
jgi:hypothetical protein